jgi:hypothetical protein
VVRTLAQAVDRSPRGLEHLAGTGDELARDEERNEPFSKTSELPTTLDEEILVASVGIPGRVGVVLEQVDIAEDALLAQSPLRVDDETFEDPLAGAIVRDQLRDAVALGGGVLRVTSDIEVESRAIRQEDIAAPAPRDDPAEQVARDLIRTEPALTVESARDAVLGLDTEYPTFRGPTLRVCRQS